MHVARTSKASAVVIATSALLLGLCGTSHAAPGSGNPMAGGAWFVDPGAAAARAHRSALAAGDVTGAAQLDLIGATPQSTWFIASDDPRSSYVRDYLARWRAGGPGTIPVIALHGLPHQNCAGTNAPGHKTGARYRAWIDHWAKRIGSNHFVVFLEPDGLAAAGCLSASWRKERFALMTYAARKLSKLPQTGVYEDAGAGDWLPVRTAAGWLKAAGVRYARGFALNSTHFDWTTAEIAYGRKLSRLVGGKHFVVNTSANGRGPEIGPHNFHVWCNPRGRALGPIPTTNTPTPLVDAFFWIGNPGLSDGVCNGGPAAGAFWMQWALELARNAGTARDYPTLHP
jgi:endoglucanase